MSCTIRSQVMALSISSNAPSMRASTLRVRKRRRTRVSSSSDDSMSVEESEITDELADVELSEYSESLPLRVWLSGKGTAASCDAERTVDAISDMNGSSRWSSSCAMRALSSAAFRFYAVGQTYRHGTTGALC